MPEKKTKADKRYEIDGKKFTWHPDVDEGETLPDVVLPLRIKLKLIREFADRPMDAAARAELLEKLAPGQAETYDEMDLGDFDAMYTTWNDEYQALSGATLGE